MSEASSKPPVVSQDGSHWESHGNSVYHYPNAGALKGKEERLTAAMATVFSYANPKVMSTEKAVVLLSVTRQPFSLSLDLHPEDADQLAAALVSAAAEVRAVRAVLASRAATKNGGAGA